MMLTFSLLRCVGDFVLPVLFIFCVLVRQAYGFVELLAREVAQVRWRCGESLLMCCVCQNHGFHAGKAKGYGSKVLEYSSLFRR